MSCRRRSWRLERPEVEGAASRGGRESLLGPSLVQTSYRFAPTFLFRRPELFLRRVALFRAAAVSPSASEYRHVPATFPVTSWAWRMIARRRAAPRASSCSVIGPPSPRRTQCVHDLRQFQTPLRHALSGGNTLGHPRTRVWSGRKCKRIANRPAPTGEIGPVLSPPAERLLRWLRLAGLMLAGVGVYSLVRDAAVELGTRRGPHRCGGGVGWVWGRGRTPAPAPGARSARAPGRSHREMRSHAEPATNAIEPARRRMMRSASPSPSSSRPLPGRSTSRRAGGSARPPSP